MTSPNWEMYKTLERMSRADLCEALILSIVLVQIGEGVIPSYYWSPNMEKDNPRGALETLKFFENMLKDY